MGSWKGMCIGLRDGAVTLAELLAIMAPESLRGEAADETVGGLKGSFAFLMYRINNTTFKRHTPSDEGQSRVKPRADGEETLLNSVVTDDAASPARPKTTPQPQSNSYSKFCTVLRLGVSTAVAGVAGAGVEVINNLTGFFAATEPDQPFTPRQQTVMNVSSAAFGMLAGEITYQALDRKCCRPS